jgi:dihydrofolate reductase/thymidylate synthase
MYKNFSIICAIDSKNGIGHNNPTTDNGMSWSFQTDFKHFKNLTLNTESPVKINAIIMGKNTANCLKKPLTGRLNIVISSSVTLDGFICVKSFEDALCFASGEQNVENIFVIGGGKLYNYAITNPYLKYVYLTRIENDYQCEIYFPNILESGKFKLLSSDETTDIDRNKNKEHVCKFMKLENMNRGEIEYLSILDELLFLDKNSKMKDMRETRSGETISSFGKHMQFDLRLGFPLLTTKKMHLRVIFEELKFFMLGQTDNKILVDKNVNIWKLNTTQEFIDKCCLPYKENDMGPMYGYQWRHNNANYIDCHTNYKNEGFDQLEYVINLLKTDPHSRRIIMTTFNPSQAKQGVLYPCHGICTQFYVENNMLSCMTYCRSSDVFLGLPYNIASYALFTTIIAKMVGMKPHMLHIISGDYHLYSNHIEQAQTQLKNMPFEFPTVCIEKEIPNIQSVSDLEFDDIKVFGYKSHGIIKADMNP